MEIPTLVIIIGLILLSLPIIVLFKIWGMANDVALIRQLLMKVFLEESPDNDELTKK